MDVQLTPEQQRLAERFIPMARRFANAFIVRRPAIGNFDDAFQGACLEVCQAAAKYEPDRGYAASTYFYFILTKHFRRHLDPMPEVVSPWELDALEVPARELDQPTPAVDIVAECLEWLPNNESLALAKYYGVGGEPRLTVQEIAAEMGKSTQWIHCLIGRALNRLRERFGVKQVAAVAA